MPRNLKLSQVPKSHTLSRKTILTIRNLSWPKSKEKILTSILTATTNLHPSFCERGKIEGTWEERKLVVKCQECLDRFQDWA